MTDRYEDFKASVFQLLGIDLNAYREEQMKRRIDTLISKYKFLAYRQYFDALKKNKEMLDEFVNYLTINVSEFYRDAVHWKRLEDDLLPALLARVPQPKIWSAACSTGEEPYSLAMLLSRYQPLEKIRIIATDIDQHVLEKAKIGIYNAKSLKELPEVYKKRYFTKQNDFTYRIQDRIKRCVDFRKHNLLKDKYPERCDAIVCRNVLIYFTEEAKNEICRKFHSALKVGGYLFLGSAEQIMQPEKMGYSVRWPFFYQKKE